MVHNSDRLNWQTSLETCKNGRSYTGKDEAP